MKKKVLLTVLFVMLLSLLTAFAVSAQDYELVDDLGDPEWYTGNYEYMTDKTSQVVLADGDGNYTAYPAYYVLKYSITISNGAISTAYINGFDYSHINQKTGKSYEAGAIYKIELPNGLTTIKNNYFGFNPKEANVVELIMPDSITTVESHAFRNDQNGADRLHLERIVFSKNLTSIGAHAFLGVSTLEEAIFPAGSDSVLDMSAQQIFMNCTSLQSIDLSTRNVISVGGQCFNGCSSLGEVKLPNTVQSIGNQCFYFCTNMYFASDFLPTSLKTVGSHFMSGCININDVLYFPDGFESFGSTCFDTTKGNPGSITLVFLGKMTGTVTLSQLAPRDVDVTLIFTKNTFADLSSKYVMSYQDGDTIGYIGKSADGNNYKENTAGTLSLVLGNPADMHTKYTEENGNTIYKINTAQCNNIYFCGGDTVEYCRDVRTTTVTGSSANFITSPFVFDVQGHIDAGLHYGLIEVISLPNCGFDGVSELTCVVCDQIVQINSPATGNHMLSSVSPCADRCSVCTLYVQKAEQSHTLDKTITYANGYDATGEYKAACSNEGCTYCEAPTEFPALFTNKGFSAAEYPGGGISIGFRVDTKAIEEYEKITGETVSYGVFAVLAEVIEENDIFGADGKALSGVIAADITDTDFDIFNLKIIGFTGDQVNIDLAMGAYVGTSKDGKTEYTYLQDGTPEAGAKYFFASYTDVMAIVNAKDGVSAQ